MSSRELERVEVMGRVGSGELKRSDAAKMLELSYRQAKRLWRRYRQVGGEGLKHGNTGQCSNRSKPLNLRRRVLKLVKKKYSGSEGERFGPTLAAEHLAEEDGVVIDHETLRRWMLEEGLWSGQRKRKQPANEGSANRILANGCSWTAVSTAGWRGVVRGGA
jgi:transposase